MKVSSNQKPDNSEVFVHWFLFSVLLLMMLSIGYSWRRLGAVPSILLLDVFDSQFTQQEPVAGLLFVIIAGLSWFLTRKGGFPNQEKVLMFFWRRWWILPLFVFGVCLVGSFQSHGLLAVSGDEYANILQTEIFSRGQLYGSWPTEIVSQMVPGELTNRILIAKDGTGKIITAYQPVFAAMAAVFDAVNLRYVFNPLIAGLVVLMTGCCVWRIWGTAWTAGLSMLMMTACVSVYGFGVSMFSTNLLLLLHLIFFWCVIGDRPLELLGAGFVGGLAMHVGNQIPHLLVALPFFAQMIVRREWRRILWVIGPYVGFVCIFSFGWTGLVQSISRLHRQEAVGASGVAGTELAWLWQHLTLPTMRQLTQDIMSLVRFFLWSAPGVLALFCLGLVRSGIFTSRWRQQKWLGPVCIAVAATGLFYFFFPLNQGYGWGYRYMQPALGFVLIIALAAVNHLDGKGRMIGLLFVSSLMSLTLSLPLRLNQIASVTAERQEALPCLGPQVKQLCFIDTAKIYWGADLVQNHGFVSLAEHANDGIGKDLPRHKASRIILFSQGQTKDAEIARRVWPDARLGTISEGLSSSSVWLP